MRRRDVDERAWRASLVGGVAVIVAVGALLEALRRSVIDVAASVDRVWNVGKRLAQNTQATHLLTTTKARSAALRAALERQAI